MIAQIATRTVILTASIISGAIGGCYVFVFKHLANNDRHPKKKDIVFREVCEVTHEGLQKTLDAKFEGIKELMKERFDNLEELVKTNGHGNPRIRT